MLSLTIVSIIISLVMFGSQMWHAQVEQSIALYQSYENSETADFLDELSFRYDDIIRGVKKGTHRFYLPLLVSKMQNDRDSTMFHLMTFDKKIHTVEQCYNHALILGFHIYMLTGCHKYTIIRLLGEHVADIFFTVRTYIYCDETINYIYRKRLDNLERLIKEIMESEKTNTTRHVFLDQEQRKAAIGAGRIEESDTNYVMISLDRKGERCTEYRRLLSIRPGLHAIPEGRPEQLSM